jgi:hypothetical protein
MRFFRVARRWAPKAMRAHSDISLSGIGFRMPVGGVMKQLKVRFGETPKPTCQTGALPIHVFA